MLPRSWFSPKAADPAALASDELSDGPPADPAADTARPPLDRAVTAALSTPHDAVLAELQGQRPGVPASAQIDASPTAPQLPTIPSQAVLTLADAGASASTVPAHAPGTLYDPATGNVASTLPTFAPAPDAALTPAGAHFEEAKDELWAQLGRIRALQGEIARRHLQMEALGACGGAEGGGGGGGARAKPPVRTHTDTIVVGEEWPDPAQAAQERARALDAEFDDLTKTFEGRRAAIDGIMSKLDDLSTVLTSFHALPTPTMDFCSLRSGTKDSLAGVFASPSPTFTTVPSSPAAAAAEHAPTSLQAQVAALDIPRADSPVSESVL